MSVSNIYWLKEQRAYLALYILHVDPSPSLEGKQGLYYRFAVDC